MQPFNILRILSFLIFTFFLTSAKIFLIEVNATEILNNSPIITQDLPSKIETDFSGLYLGLGIGVGYGYVQQHYSTYNFANKAEYSLIAGYLHKLNKYIYIGGEFDYMLINNTSGFDFIDGTTRSSMINLNNLINFSFLIGFNLFKDIPVMPFVSIGATMGQMNYARDQNDLNIQSSKWIGGVKIGGGFNFQLAKNLIFRAEYIANIMYGSYQSNLYNFHDTFFINSIRFGLLYKFTL